MYSQITELKINTATPYDKIKQNVLDAAAHCLPPIDSLIAAHGDAPIALIGGGPSLSYTEWRLWDYPYSMVCGSAHDYVVSKGILPTYCIICDPDPIMCEYIRHKRPEITYLIASQCDISMFEWLSDMPKKYIWHVNGSEDYNKDIYKNEEKLVIGGCTVGTRAIGMSMALGFKTMHLYGYDTCLANNYKHHAYDFIDEEKESLGNIIEVQLDQSPGTQKFKVAGYMLGQILDFQNILHNYHDKIQLTVFGGGLLAAIMQKANEKMIKYKEQKNG